MAIWEWHQSFHEPASPVVKNPSVQFTLFVDSGWSMQRVITFGGFSQSSNDPWGAVGNPIYTPYDLLYSLVYQRQDGTQEILVKRRTSIVPQAQAYVVTPEVHRTAVWPIPTSFWDFDCNLRDESHGDAALIGTIQWLPVADNDETIYPDDPPQGGFYVRMLWSKPGQ